MIKKLIVLFGILFCGSLYGAQIVNVEYIHNAIKQKWDITVPYNAALSNPRVAANMKYLLTAIDVANEMLNGEPTEYGTGAYATSVAADTVATNTAVDGLIQQVEKYSLELVHDYLKESMFAVRDPNYLIMISAAGKFYVDWGDGTEEVIDKKSVGEQWFGHDYATDGTYTIRLGGRATKYSDDPDLSTVILSGDGDCMHSIGGDIDGTKCPIDLLRFDGCLGCIFPTLVDGSQPRFRNTFAYAYNLSGVGIPAGLFDGISGALVENMFRDTFCADWRLTGPSARINGRYLYEIWPGATSSQVGGMYSGCDKLDDYANIPDAWK